MENESDLKKYIKLKTEEGCVVKSRFIKGTASPGLTTNSKCN